MHVIRHNADLEVYVEFIYYDVYIIIYSVFHRIKNPGSRDDRVRTDDLCNVTAAL